jgi:hypothetical protein
LVRDSRPVKRGIEEIAAPVAGKHPPGPVGSVGGGSQADDQEAPVGVSKRGHGLRVVGLPSESGSRLLRDLGAPFAQPRAAVASQYASVLLVEPGHFRGAPILADQA